MVCDHNETDLDIKIPTVLLPKDAGVSLEKILNRGDSGWSSYICSLLPLASIIYM